MQSFINRIIRHPLRVLEAGAARLLASQGAIARVSCSRGGGIVTSSVVASPTSSNESLVCDWVKES